MSDCKEVKFKQRNPCPSPPLPLFLLFLPFLLFPLAQVLAARDGGSREGGSYRNVEEARVALRAVEALAKAGGVGSIALLTPYRGQVCHDFSSGVRGCVGHVDEGSGVSGCSGSKP